MMTPSNQADKDIEDSAPPQLSDLSSIARTKPSPSSLVSAGAAADHTSAAGKPSSGSPVPNEGGADDSDVTLSSESSPRVLKKMSSMSDNDIDNDLKGDEEPGSGFTSQAKNESKESEEARSSSPPQTDPVVAIKRNVKDGPSKASPPLLPQPPTPPPGASSPNREAHKNTKPFPAAPSGAFNQPTAFEGGSDQSMANSSRSSGYSANSQISGVSPPIAVIPVPVSVGKRGKSSNHARAPSSDSSSNSRHSTKSKAAPGLRRGKWTVEEEAYVARVIQDFNAGFLNTPAGTTLRSYLSEKLHCDPMRITKKFTGDSCIGKRVFHPAVRCASNAGTIDKAQTELDALERRWRRRVEMQQRESAKKAAASAAAAAVVASGRAHPSLHANKTDGRSPGQPLAASAGPVVARTASWLDRATAALAPKCAAASSVEPATAKGKDPSSLSPSEIEDQMRQVQQLIHEGPAIQQTTADLNQTRVAIPSLSTSLTGQPHVDKRARTDSGASIEEAHDAEALVGFLQSVHASAASTSNP